MNPWLNKVLDILLPRQCVLCGYGSDQFNICSPCSRELPRIFNPCTQCALPLPDPGGRMCGRCQVKPAPWDSAIAALIYEFPVDQLVRRFKFSRSLACGQILGQELAAVVNQCQEFPEVMIPVPLHHSRLFTRMFNQSERLARQIGKATGISVENNLMQRKRRTRAHSGLDATLRKTNIRGAFVVNPHRHNRTLRRHVALVDDVMTTGATLAECSRTLKASGVRRVSVWVACRAPAPPGNTDQ